MPRQPTTLKPLPVYEVVMPGFDGSTDNTDGRVLWVAARNAAEVARAIDYKAAVTRVPYVTQDDAGVDFVLPAGTEAFRLTIVHTAGEGR